MTKKVKPAITYRGDNDPLEDMLDITPEFPGLHYRPIGPGDDIVVSAEVLAEWVEQQRLVAQLNKVLELEKAYCNAVSTEGWILNQKAALHPQLIGKNTLVEYEGGK